MATIEMKLNPWRAPNFATIADAPDAKSIPVADLPADVLQDMACAWLEDLYAKAGKRIDWLD